MINTSSYTYITLFLSRFRILLSCDTDPFRVAPPASVELPALLWFKKVRYPISLLLLIEGWTKKLNKITPRALLLSVSSALASGSLRSADCAVCSDGYAPQLGFTCTKCLDAASGAVLASFVLVAIAFAAVAVASYVMSGERPGKRRGVVERVARFVPLQSIKIVVVSWQILTQVRAAHFSCVHIYICVYFVCRSGGDKKCVTCWPHSLPLNFLSENEQRGLAQRGSSEGNYDCWLLLLL